MRRTVPLLALAAIAAPGCGPPQPQAPAPTANRVAEALSGITAACAEHTQLQTLPGTFGAAGARQASVLSAARTRATELRHAVAANPAWVYQGKTLAEVRRLARRRLRECGLSAAAVGL